MRLLLDTHALIWWWGNDPKLQNTAASELLAEPGHDVFVSAASAWEIATKKRLGKLDPGIAMDAFEEAVLREGFIPLQIDLRHALRAGTLESTHGDPFDRMLASQAELEGLVLLTRDPVFAGFPCQTLW